MVDENLREATIRLRGHTVIRRRDIALDGEPAIDVAAEWRGSSTKIYTRQTHVFLGATWLVISCNTPMTSRDESDAIMDRLLATGRLRSDASGL